MQKTVAFHSFGCKLNQSETQVLEKNFIENGYKVVRFGEKADYYLIDTCTVTDQADSKARNIIRKAERNNPEARMIVTGCMAQMESEKIKEISPNSLVIGTFEKFNMFEILKDAEKEVDFHGGVFINEYKNFVPTQTQDVSARTRAYLKVQDGCNYICSYCIIPFSRGRDRSNKFEMSLREAKELIRNGYKEIILTGVNIGEYKDGNRRIDDLVEALSEIDGLQRLRISSIEPNTVSDKLIRLVKERKNIMPHFHLPFQSGSSEVLKKMRRHYNQNESEHVLDKIMNNFSNFALGSDFIVGFPGETDKNFQETVDFIEKYPFTYYHTFTYSKRQKTIAEKMENHLPNKLKSERSEFLRKLMEQKKLEFAQKNIGNTFSVLFEGKKESGYQNGFSENYIKIFIENENSLANEVHQVKLEKILDGKAFGRIV